VARYPRGGAARNRFVLERRGERPPHDPWRHQGVLVEDEPGADGRIGRVATIFLTGRECPWRCAMCDLWQYTITEDTPAGAIPAQILSARSALGEDPVTCLKLYNAGSFFDPRAVPECDYDAIAAALGGIPRVIVECHPSLVGPRVARFLAALASHTTRTASVPRLEIAMGLETAHPVALEALNKRMTVEDFAEAAGRIRELGAALRVFLLIAPPFVRDDEQDSWLGRSIDVAFSCGASVVSLVPARSGNGTMQALAAAGSFRAPRLSDIERSVRLARTWHAGRGRIFVDVWDLDRFSTCDACLDSRRDRLLQINLSQQLRPDVVCAQCGYGP
jgi:radical SAM enzyme (TIGR01210 family)